MSNGQLHDDKLFQGLHDRLSDYEAPYDGADWDAMSRSLDKLPKTNNFRWKFSLNTIGIMLGIVGLTVVGVVIAAGNGKTPRPAETTTVTVTTPQNNTATVQPVKPQATTPSVTENSVNGMPVAIQEVNSYRDLRTPKKTEEFNNPFRLGDQINPLKGFVKQTQEDPALLNHHGDLKEPEVYYDIDDNGKIKPIHIDKQDGDSSVNEIKVNDIKQDTTASPQAPAPEPDPQAPTDGQRYGFGDDNPRQ